MSRMGVSWQVEGHTGVEGVVPTSILYFKPTMESIWSIFKHNFCPIIQCQKFSKHAIKFVCMIRSLFDPFYLEDL